MDKGINARVYKLKLKSNKINKICERQNSPVNLCKYDYLYIVDKIWFYEI